MLPIYIGNYTYNKKVYNFYINGSNGKISGSAPVSGWKIALLILVIILALSIPFIISAIVSGVAISTF